VKKSGIEAASSISLKDQANKYLFDQLDHYINALLLQGRKEKRQNGLEQTEAIIDLLQSGLFSKLPTHYSPRPKSSQSTGAQKKIDYKTMFGKKKFFSRVGTKNLSNIIPKLDDLFITEQPLLLLCNRALQIIPWELMLSEFTTRAFSLQNALKQTSVRERYLTTNLSFYSED